MDELHELLKNHQLTEDAISLYINCIEKAELTKDEIISLVPQLSSENFIAIINELINLNLYLQIPSKKPEIPDYYLAIPPFSILLENFSNINEIILSNQELIKNSINQVFKGDNKIELNSAFTQFQMLAKEHTEAITSQKKNFENNMVELGKIDELNKTFDNLNEIVTNLNDATTTIHQNIRGVAQSQFGNLIKILKTIRTQLGIELKKVDSKHVDEIVNLVEKVFSSEFKEMVDRFTDTIFSLIDLEFQNFETLINQLIYESIKLKVQEPISSITSNLLKIQNDSRMIASNMINKFDDKLEEIKRILITNKDSIPTNLKNLENLISDNINEIFQDSTNKILELKNIIENIQSKFAAAPKRQLVAKAGEGLESQVEPKPGDKVGLLINTALNELLEKINKLQGYQFSNELQKISDLITEKAGFSVSSTLHKISTMVSIYKPKYENLEIDDVTQIYKAIELWKQEIFSKTGMHL